MTTAFEFLPRNQRKPVRPIASIVAVPVTLAAFFIGILIFQKSSKNLELEYQKAQSRVEALTMDFISRAEQKLPNERLFADLTHRIEKHNLKTGARRSSWTKFFNTLDIALPDDSVIIALKNQKTGNSSFAPDDREFKIEIAVASIEDANALYRNLSTLPQIESLNFAPRGEIVHQGRTGVSITIDFRFNENYVQPSL